MANNEQPRSDKLGERRAILKRHPVMGIFSALILRTFFTFHPNGRAVREPDNRIGLLENSIIGNPLCYPLDEQYTAQEIIGGGEWVAYDFHRPYKLPARRDGRAHRQLRKGKLLAFMLDNIKDSRADDPTPTSLLNLQILDHAISFDRPGIENLVAEEYVTPTTYAAAYRRAGAYEQFAVELDAKGVMEQQTYQVTPKGNSLIFLIPATGKPQPKTQTEPGPFSLPRFLPKPVTG